MFYATSVSLNSALIKSSIAPGTMRSIKLVARDWVKDPVNVLWMVTRLNRMNVKVQDKGNYLRAYCSDNDAQRFKEIAHRFCLVCDLPNAC